MDSSKLSPFERPRPSITVPVIRLASSNPSKLAEFRLGVGLWAERMAAREGNSQKIKKWIVEPVPGIDSLPACVEDGDTFSLNAQKKALHYSRFASGLVLGDDSGLEVDALEGAPGVRSRRFAGVNATDAQNNAKLLQELQTVPPSKRGAQFVCVLVLARSGQLVAEFRGVARGLLLPQQRGTGGFGYDPLFVEAASDKTFAEMLPEEKLERSHRGKAIEAMLNWLAANPSWLCGER